MVFGDSSTTSIWESDSRIEIHGPGYSKIVIGEDCIDDWEKYLDVMVGFDCRERRPLVHQRVGRLGAAAR